MVKIFYNLSDKFIDEPHFEEIRLHEENFVRINFHKSAYHEFFGKIKSVPIGMLSRKDLNSPNNNDDDFMFTKKKSVLPEIQGHCEERHLEDLLGMIDITLMFGPDMTLMENQEIISIPACKVVPLSSREQIPLETIIAKKANNEHKDRKKKIVLFHKLIMDLKEACSDEKKLEKIPIEEIKEHLNKFEELNIEEEFEISKLDDYDAEKMMEVKDFLFFYFI